MNFLIRWGLCLPLLLAACVGSGVRQVQVRPLGPYAQTRQVAITVAGDGPQAMKADLRDAFTAGLRGATGLQPTASPDPAAFQLALHLINAQVPAQAVEPTGKVEAFARGAVGQLGMGPLGAGRLTFEATLRAPDGATPLGVLRYDRHGDSVSVLEEAGKTAGETLGRQMSYREDQFVSRRAADERLFLIPTPLTLEKGEWFISDDELLLLRAGVGVSRRVQLDIWAGGLPLYGPLGAGAGAVFLGVVDLGVKVAVLQESARLPGLSLSYDFLNVFGAGAAGTALPVGGGGLVVGAGAGNAQFNLFTAVASKHFADTQVVLGTYLLDNHHILPQEAVFATPDGATTQPIDRVPLQVQPFLGIEQVLGPHSALAVECLPRDTVRGSKASAGVRWLLGWSAPRGPLALDRIRFRVDLAAVVGEVSSGSVLVAPWLGLGMYVARSP